MLKTIIKKLYIKYVDPDVASITRQQLGLFDVPIDLEELSHDKRETYYIEASKLLENETLNYVLDKLVAEVKDGMFHRSEDKQMIYDRFTLNGLYLVKERLQWLTAMMESQEEEYNIHEVL